MPSDVDKKLYTHTFLTSRDVNVLIPSPLVPNVLQEVSASIALVFHKACSRALRVRAEVRLERANYIGALKDLACLKSCDALLEKVPP